GQYLFQAPSLQPGVTCDSLNISELTGNQNLHSNSSTLSTAFPNPFVDFTIIQFTLINPSVTSLQIFDVNGREVKTFFKNEMLSAGNHSVNFYAENNPQGLYYYVLRSNEQTEVEKMVLMK